MKKGSLNLILKLRNLIPRNGRLAKIRAISPAKIAVPETISFSTDTDSNGGVRGGADRKRNCSLHPSTLFAHEGRAREVKRFNGFDHSLRRCWRCRCPLLGSSGYRQAHSDPRRKHNLVKSEPNDFANLRLGRETEDCQDP